MYFKQRVLLPWDCLQFSPVSIKVSAAVCVSVLIGNVVNANRGNAESEFSSITLTHSGLNCDKGFLSHCNFQFSESLLCTLSFRG